MSNLATLVIGANGAIARAIIEKHLSAKQGPVFAISRGFSPDYHKQFGISEELHTRVCDNSQVAIGHAVEELTRHEVLFNRIYICNGMLHSSSVRPEKRLEDIQPEHFEQVMHVNVTVPMLWIKHLLPLTQHTEPAAITVLSARVGSIADNGLGGWYSYRASKSALNMVIKTAGVEYARRAKNVKLVAFHPGTTDSALSKPFQHNVPKGKLFRPEFVAKQLYHLLSDMTPDTNTSFIDWQGKPIPW